jgi:hypothetical protein
MKPQYPAEGVMTQDSFGNYKQIVVACHCSDPTHSAHIYIAADDDDDCVTVNFSVETDYHCWAGWKDRLRAAYDILFRGSSVRHHDLLLSKQAALNMAHALAVSIEEVELNKTA